MSFIDKFLNIMRLNDEDDDDYDDLMDDYMDEEEENGRKSSFRNRNRQEETPVHTASSKEKPAKPERAERPVKTSPKITPISKGRKQDSGMEVCVIKPTSVEDAREITETLLKGKTILLNVEGLNVDIAQRIIDFTSGSCFAISGNLQMVSNYIFIITPYGVDISGDLESLLGSFEGFGI